MTDFRCPRCQQPLDRESGDGFFCRTDRLTFERRGGIWRFLLPETAARTAVFVREYETIRRAEGRGWELDGYYRRLPETGRDDPQAAMWRFRAAGFRCFADRVLRPRGTRRLRIADLGAGNGWLSNRLAARGHEVDAIDLLDNDWDGLGAHRRYETSFRPVQAAFDLLPYRPGLFDLAVFNASFHYAADYSRTLDHVLARLKPGGALAILDTPVYRREASGRQMVAERERDYTSRYGFPSNAIPLENFLTYDRLDSLAEEFDLRIRLHRPRYPLRRRMAPVLARLRGRREPAAFPVIVLERSSA